MGANTFLIRLTSVIQLCIIAYRCENSENMMKDRICIFIVGKKEKASGEAF
jgi:hypothetical protein